MLIGLAVVASILLLSPLRGWIHLNLGTVLAHKVLYEQRTAGRTPAYLAAMAQGQLEAARASHVTSLHSDALLRELERLQVDQTP